MTRLEPPPMQLARRELLTRAVLLTSAIALPLPFASCRAFSPSPTGTRSSARTFDAHEWSVIEATTARIVPTDDLPGAKEANVVGFIDAELSEPHFTVFRREFRAGVNAIELLATSKFGNPFLNLTTTEQDEVLAGLQGGDGSTRAFSAAHFFLLLLTLTIEGLFSDPVHGGNRNGAGWEILGIAPPEPRHGSHTHHG